MLKNLSPSIMSDIFKLKETKYELRTGSNLQSYVPHTETYGIDSVSYLAPKIWSIIPTEIKTCENLHTFKRLIKKWIPTSCPCRLCRTCPNLGFI